MLQAESKGDEWAESKPRPGSAQSRDFSSPVPRTATASHRAAAAPEEPTVSRIAWHEVVEVSGVKNHSAVLVPAHVARHAALGGGARDVLLLLGGYDGMGNSDSLRVLFPEEAGAGGGSGLGGDGGAWGGDAHGDGDGDDAQPAVRATVRTVPASAVGGTPPTARNGHSATLVGEWMAVLGGWEGIGPLSADDLHLLHVPTLTWIEPLVGGTPPGPCNMHTADLVEGDGGSGPGGADSVWVFRGGDGCAYYNQLFVLRFGTAAGARARSRASSRASARRAEGDAGEAAPTVAAARGAPPQPSLEWEEPACTGAAPPCRANHASAVVGRLLFIFGGWTGRRRLNDLHCLDTRTLAWAEVETGGAAALPHPRAGMSMSAVRGRLLVFGGSGSGLRCFNDCHLFEPDGWSPHDDQFTEVRRAAGACSMLSTLMPCASCVARCVMLRVVCAASTATARVSTRRVAAGEHAPPRTGPVARCLRLGLGRPRAAARARRRLRRPRRQRQGTRAGGRARRRGCQPVVLGGRPARAGDGQAAGVPRRPQRRAGRAAAVGGGRLGGRGLRDARRRRRHAPGARGGRAAPAAVRAPAARPRGPRQRLHLRRRRLPGTQHAYTRARARAPHMHYSSSTVDVGEQVRLRGTDAARAWPQVEGKVLYAHRLVLSLVSDRFHAQFTSGFRESSAPHAGGEGALVPIAVDGGVQYAVFLCMLVRDVAAACCHRRCTHITRARCTARYGCRRVQEHIYTDEPPAFDSATVATEDDDGRDGGRDGAAGATHAETITASRSPHALATLDEVCAVDGGVAMAVELLQLADAYCVEHLRDCAAGYLARAVTGRRHRARYPRRHTRAPLRAGAVRGLLRVARHSNAAQLAALCEHRLRYDCT